ncbi:MAG TPA: SsgA family sporulation/cell division regulator [Actinomycetes bacterium]|nr:SsgA family sporulation/cell division regulator [Actinomycetes bacterium]
MVPAALTSSLQLRLVTQGGSVHVPAELCYDPTDPYAVTATFRSEDDAVAWTFSRDLLDEGLVAPAGEGDVAVWPCSDDDGEVVCIALSSPFGQALLEAQRHEVEAFIVRSFQTVPRGSESDLLDLDAEIAALLG